MFKNIGTGEILIICLVVMVLFGSKKLPELAKGLHEAVTEFGKGFKDDPTPPSKKKSGQKEKETELPANK